MMKTCKLLLGIWLGMLLGAASPSTEPPKPLSLAADSDSVDISAKYFVGGVKEVPGDVVKKYYEQCAAKQTTKPCTWFSKLFFCDPTLMCNGQKWWSKKKGWNVGK